jgi:peptide deformylase
MPILEQMKRNKDHDDEWRNPKEETGYVRIYPDPILIKKATPVRHIDGQIKALIDNMAEVMYAYQGVGLAAPQVGVSERVIIVDIGEGLRALINPEIVEGEGESILEEGCLSLPEIEVAVKRKQKILVRGWGVDGKEVDGEVSDFLGRVYQHEIDHLNGILIIHHLSRLKRELLVKKMFKKRKGL